MLRRGLRDLDADMRVTLHCSRADRPTLAAIVERMAEAGEHSIGAVEADADLETGTCRLESAGVSVELGIRAQLDLLEELLLREEQSGLARAGQDAVHSASDSRMTGFLPGRRE
jgi:flagellar biosynthesis/type III secretory pathway protein FliH